jgi:anti-anti-sigma regulatory factor
MTDFVTNRVLRIEPGTGKREERCGRATFSAFRRPPSGLVVTVLGEVDATNGRALARYVEGRIVVSTELDVDLRLVEFFGTAGFAALHNINVICCQYDARWVLRANPRLCRLLRICDPDGSLPLDETLSAPHDVDAGPGDRQFLIGRNN